MVILSDDEVLTESVVNMPDITGDTEKSFPESSEITDSSRMVVSSHRVNSDAQPLREVINFVSPKSRMIKKI